MAQKGCRLVIVLLRLYKQRTACAISPFTICLISILLSTGLQAEDDRISRLRNDINYMCSQELAGRDVPGTGGDLTADWLQASFREIGFTPTAAGATFYQEFQLLMSSVDTSKTKLTIILPDRMVTLSWGTHFYIFPRKIGNYEAELELAYAHYGIVSAELDRDDFAQNARGKAALVMNGSGNIQPQRAGRHGMTPFKAAAARRAGAELMVVMYTEDDELWIPPYVDRKIQESTGLLTDLPDSQPGFITVHLNGTAQMPGDSAGSSLAEDVFKVLVANSENEFVKLHLKLIFHKSTIHIGRNVVGKISGKTDEFILFGAHYDHLGVKQENEDGNLVYYPGADDNASGISVLLEISRLWKSRSQADKGLLIVAFGAEEDGMLGSKFFADNLPVPQGKIIGMINLDMIGRNGYASMRALRQGSVEPDPDYAALFYSAASPQLSSIMQGSGISANLHLDFKPINNFRFSDAGFFNSIGIPTISIFGGFHSDYNQINDRPEFINWEKLAKMVLLTDKLLLNFSSATEKIEFDNTIKAKSAVMRY